MNSRLESLHMIERAVWRELARAAVDRLHAWHVMVLATVTEGLPEARSVVLREVDESKRRLLFYTDSRSPKTAQLQARPQAVLVAWSPSLGWQARMQVACKVERDGLDVASRWVQVKASTGGMEYLAALPPGTPVETFKPERGAREHFAVITATVQSLDWLELHEAGHRRARFDAEGRRWLTP